MTEKGNLKLVCCFCGKDRTNVKHMIRGNANSIICDECVELSTLILKERQTEKPKPEAGEQ